MKQYAALDDTVYFWFAANDTSGSGGNGATPAADVRLAGAAADAIPVYSPTPALLTHANYPAGAYEIAIIASTGNGFAVNNTYAVFCTLAIDGQNPTGFVGSFDLKPIEANVTQIGDAAQSATDLKDFADAGYDPDTNKLVGLDTSFNSVIADIVAIATKEEQDTSFNTVIAKTNNIPANPATEAKQDTIISDVGGIATKDQQDTSFNIVIEDTAEIVNLPTKTEQDTSFNSAITEINANETKIDAIATKTQQDTSFNTVMGATFVEATDSLEALRDRGDAAWVTGAGGSDRLLMIDTTIATLASQTSFTLTAGSADDDAYNNATIVIEDASTATQKAIGIISNYVGSSKTITLKYDPGIFTMAPTDKIYILAENALKATLANRQLNVAADGDIAGNVDGSVASVTGHTVQTGDSYAIVADDTSGNAAIESLVDDLESRCTEARLAELDAANIPTDIAALPTKTQTDASFNTVMADLDNPDQYKADVSTLPTKAQQDTSFNTAITEINANETKIDAIATKTQQDVSFNSIPDLVWDEVLTAAIHNVATSAGRRLRQAEDVMIIHEETCQAGGGNNEIILDAGASAVNGFYINDLVVLTSGTGVGQQRHIDSYVGATKTATVNRDWTTNPDATTTFSIKADSSKHVHGFETAAKAEIKTEAGAALSDYDGPTKAEMDISFNTIIAKTNDLPSGVPKNVALSNFAFLMTDASDNSPKTGLTVTVQLSKDGAAFASSTNSAVEIANGLYKIDLTQVEMNAGVIIFKATAADANQSTLVLVTST